MDSYMKKMKKSSYIIVCFMLIMGISVLVVEIIARAKEKAKAQEIETKRDVFK